LVKGTRLSYLSILFMEFEKVLKIWKSLNKFSFEHAQTQVKSKKFDKFYTKISKIFFATYIKRDCAINTDSDRAFLCVKNAQFLTVWHNFFKPDVHNGTRKIGYPANEHMKERCFCAQ